MKSERGKDAIGEMLTKLGKAVSEGNMKGVSDSYVFPALFMSDEGSFVMNNADELEKMFAEGQKWYIEQGIVETRPELESIDEMTDTIAAVNVSWPGFDKDGKQTEYTETSHYILQMDNGNPRIRVAMTRTK